MRRVRVVSAPPFPFELAKHNIFVRSIDRNREQNDEGDAFPRVRRASLSDMTCYSAVHLLHFLRKQESTLLRGRSEKHGGSDFDRGITVPCQIMEHC